jgi:hypothetical protein
MALILAVAFCGCVRAHYSVRGSVVDDKGKPVESALVAWWPGECAEHTGRTPNALDVTDESGVFELDFTGPANLAAAGLQIQKGGYAAQCVAAPSAQSATCQGPKCEQLHIVLAKD